MRPERCPWCEKYRRLGDNGTLVRRGIDLYAGVCYECAGEPEPEPPEVLPDKRGRTPAICGLCKRPKGGDGSRPMGRIRPEDLTDGKLEVDGETVEVEPGLYVLCQPCYNEHFKRVAKRTGIAKPSEYMMA